MERIFWCWERYKQQQQQKRFQIVTSGQNIRQNDGRIAGGLLLSRVARSLKR